MAALNISNLQISSISFADLSNITLSEYFEIVKPLMIFIVGIFIYSIFIFKFYKFISKRDILKLKTDKYSASYEGFFAKIIKLVFYILENLVLVPLLIFFWFVILSILFLVLSKTSSPNHILLISVSLVAAVRIAAYYNEALSQDLAKMIPFALLGIFLVDTSFFSIDKSLEIAKQIPSLWRISVYYLLIVVTLEFVLRIIHWITSLFSSSEDDLSHFPPLEQE